MILSNSKISLVEKHLYLEEISRGTVTLILMLIVKLPDVDFIVYFYLCDFILMAIFSFVH